MPATPEDKAAYGRGRTVKTKAEKKGNTTALGRLQELLPNLDLSDVGEVKSLWLKTGGKKAGADEITGASILLSPSWEHGPEWPVVQAAAPVTVNVPKRNAPAMVGNWKTAVILPDPQIGFRRLADGTLDPFHDEAAISVALQIVEAERPDLTICLGDLLDFPSFGKYRQEPSFARTTQPTLNRAHSFLSAAAALSKETRLIEGNHDMRLANAIIDNAAEAFGIRRANVPDEWPVMSVPNLLRLDEIGARYVGGYPVGATYINDNLACIHGRKASSATSPAAAKVVSDEQVSVIFGHDHRIQTIHKTRNLRNRPAFTFGHSPGCLCRIDGAVPGTAAGLDPHGRPVRHWQNWQQGVSVVRYEPGDGRLVLESVEIVGGWAMHRGQEFCAEGAA